MSSSVPMVTLKDGSQVHPAAFITVHTTIENLAQKNYLAFYELVEKCRNPEHQIMQTPFGDMTRVLKDCHLIEENGRIHDGVRKIVVNSVKGLGLSIGVIPLQRERVSVVEKKEKPTD